MFGRTLRGEICRVLVLDQISLIAGRVRLLFFIIWLLGGDNLIGLGSKWAERVIWGVFVSLY